MKRREDSMILEVELLKDEKISINLGDGKFQIKDTISDWVVADSNEVTLAVFDKFSTVYIVLKDS